MIRDEDIPATVRERFDIVDHFAGGAVTQALKAVDKRTGATVLVSLFNTYMRDVEAARANFLARTSFASEVGSHPNLNFPTDWDLEAGYIVTPFIDGLPLRAFLEQGPLPVGAVVRIFQGVARGIAHLHRAGFVHRDIVLHNIIVDAGRNAKIADFGAAGRLQDQKPGSICGIPQYIAPEVLAGRAGSGVSSDLYMIGVCLYAVLTGDLPYRGKMGFGHLELIASARRGIPPVREVNPSAWSSPRIVDSF